MNGRLAFVTGGAGGIGFASAEALVKRGAKVILSDIDHAAARKKARDIIDAGGQAAAVTLDVADREACKSVAAAVAKEHGPVSILVNNAGIGGPARLGEPESPTQWDRSISINLTGAFNVTTAFLDGLKSTRGVVVNIASVVAFTSGFAHAGYTASKGGVRALTQAMCRELAQFGMRVNGVAPGYIDTPMGGKGKPHIDEWMRFHCPMQRHGRPEEIGAVVAFLCSDEASYVNGTTVPVDGGYLAV